MQLKLARRKRKKWSESTALAVVVSVVLVVGVYLFPMPTSLGQGVNERVATGWQAVYMPSTGQEYYRMTFNDSSYLQYPISGLPRSLFTKHTIDGSLISKSNLIGVIESAYVHNAKGVEQTLGTYHNVPDRLHPFDEEPVAYTAQLLQVMAKDGFNPSTVGGPNIPPGSVSKSQLKGGMLQIDTKSDGNTLAQCQPGQRPLVLG